ncbi:MAG TPA: hypothetical protein VFI56_18610, partial [Vicinamibacterales bacterium]|nr:hypothetical protein [Vicinamibacterales bacterium]
RVDDPVDLFLAELCQLEPRLFRATGERAGLGYRREIAICLWAADGFGHRPEGSSPRTEGAAVLSVEG